MTSSAEWSPNTARHLPPHQRPMRPLVAANMGCADREFDILMLVVYFSAAFMFVAAFVLFVVLMVWRITA